MQVQGLWVGNKISKIEFMSYNSFIKNGFEYILYTYDNIEGLPEKIIVRDANKIVDRSLIVRDSNNSLGGFSDLFRWNLLYKNGGIYVDSDIICLKEFETENNVASGEVNMIAINMAEVKASTQYLKFEQGSPIMEYAVKESEKKDLSKIAWADIGPKLIQKLLPKNKILNYNNFNANHYWNWNYVLEKDKTDFLLELSSKKEVYGIHLWNEMWRRAGISKEQEFEDGSFIKILEKKYLGE